MRHPASAISPAPTPSSKPAIAGRVGYARDARIAASATTGSAVAADPAKHTPPISHHSLRNRTGLAFQLNSVMPITIAIGIASHNAIALGLHPRPGTDSRSAATTTARPKTDWINDRPQMPLHPRFAASGRTLKAIGAANSATSAIGNTQAPRDSGDRSTRTGW